MHKVFVIFIWDTVTKIYGYSEILHSLEPTRMILSRAYVCPRSTAPQGYKTFGVMEQEPPVLRS